VKISAGNFVLAGFLVVPLLLLTLSPATITVSGPRLIGLGVASLTAIAAVILFCFAAAAAARRRAKPSSRTQEIHRETKLIVGAGGALLATEALLLAASRWQLALAYSAVLVAYVAMWIPAGMRRIGFRAAVLVRCTPEAAFALVSDPNNWPRYWPNLELRERPALPLHVGDVIHDRVTTGGLTLDAEELVTDFVAGREFGTSVIGGRGSRGIYLVNAVDGGTEVAYVYETKLRLSEAWMGNALSRGSLTERLKSNRLAALERVKKLLEAEPVPTV
jgi:Polyketide cyclase / dehydrase and lipid transport